VVPVGHEDRLFHDDRRRPRPRIGPPAGLRRARDGDTHPGARSSGRTFRPGGAPGLASIAGTTWTLVELDGRRVTATDRGPTLSIDGSRASGHSGCNRWGADVATPAAGEWALGPIASTRMACEEDEMKLEQRFLAALAATSRWKVEGSRLLLSDGDGKVRLAFSGQRPG